MLAWCWLGIRCARLIAVLPVQLWRTWQRSRHLSAAYRRVVAPIVSARSASSARRTAIDQRLSGWAVQGGYLIDSYSRLIDRPGAEDVAVAAASFTRLYDDVLDERLDPELGARLATLFDGQQVGARSDIEWIVGDLFRWLARGVPAHHEDALYGHLQELHCLQLEVIDGRSAKSPPEVVELTRRKGGAGMAILGGLVNPCITEGEFALLYRLGGLLQLIDDFDDAFEDHSVRTSANFGRVGFAVLAAELRAVSRDLVRTYGARRARPFVDGLYNWLVLVGIRRVLDRVRRFDGHRVKVPRSQLAMVTLRKQHIR